MIYWALFSAASAVALTVRGRPNRVDAKMNLPLALLLLFVVGILGLRSAVGTDFPLYLRLFERLNPDFWSQSLEANPQEAGFTALALAVKSLTSNPQAIFLVVAALTIAAFVLGMRWAGAPLGPGLVMYIGLAHYLAAFNIMRQSLAVTIVFAAVMAWQSGRRMWGLLFFATAAFIHGSTLIAGLVILAAWVVRNNLLLVLVSASLTLSATYFSSHIASFARIFGEVNARYSDYAAEVGAGGASLGTLLVLVSRIFVIGWIFYYAREHVRIKPYSLWIRIAILGLPFLAIGVFNPVLARLELYLAIFLVPVLAHTWLEGRAVGRKLILWVGIAAYFTIYALSFGDLMPYRARW